MVKLLPDPHNKIDSPAGDLIYKNIVMIHVVTCFGYFRARLSELISSAKYPLKSLLQRRIPRREALYTAVGHF